MEYSLVPSLPAASWEELESLLQALTGVSVGFQVDLVDGSFAPSRSWPFTEAAAVSDIARLKPYATTYELEIDCMIEQPEQYLDQLVGIGASRVIVHYGSTAVWETILSHQRTHGYLLGLAITNDIPLAAVTEPLSQVGFVQVMGIATVGAQGQPFDERTLETVTTLRAAYPALEIAVDGSVNADTIPRLLAVGANRFAPGSAISRAVDPVAAYKQLQALL